LIGWSARGVKFDPLVVLGATNIAATTAEANSRRVITRAVIRVTLSRISSLRAL
jgi:hypothetical protein